MKQPDNVFTIEEADHFMSLVSALVNLRESKEFHEWCEEHANELSRAVLAWTQFEELIRRSCISELMYYSSPGEFLLKLSQAQGLNGFDLESIDPEQEWTGRTLDDCVGEALSDLLDAEEMES